MKPNVSKFFGGLLDTSKSIWETHGTKIMFYSGLACTAVAGVLSAVGTTKASEKLAKAKETQEEPLTLKEELKVTVPCYLPAVVTWGVGAGLSIGGFKTEVTNGISALAAYKMAELAKSELEKSTAEVVGPNKVKKIHENIAKEHRESHPIMQSNIVITGHGDALFYEPWSQQYFKSSSDAIYRAVTKAKNKLYDSPEDYVTMNDWFGLLGINQNYEWGDNFIFTIDKNPIDIGFDYTKDEDGTPCGEIYYSTEPVYDRL